MLRPNLSRFRSRRVPFLFSPGRLPLKTDHSSPSFRSTSSRLSSSSSSWFNRLLNAPKGFGKFYPKGASEREGASVAGKTKGTASSSTSRSSSSAKSKSSSKGTGSGGTGGGLGEGGPNPDINWVRIGAAGVLLSIGLFSLTETKPGR